MLPYPDIPDRAHYGRVFTDVSFWMPYVRAICARHDLACDAVTAGYPGTNPVFVVDESHVIKLYTDFFDGSRSRAVERAVYGLLARRSSLARQPVLPAPRLMAEGDLYPPGTCPSGAWRYPYLITTALPGRSLTEAPIGASDRLALARTLGEALAALHTVPVEGLAAFPPGEWDAFLCARRATCAADQAAWGTLPPHLVAQIEDYLPAPDELLAEGRRGLIHADLNADHVLGRVEAGGWRLTGIIDFGDARVGDLAYELVALHLGLFGCDRALLGEFLRWHGGFTPDAAFARRAMAMTLLHEFDVLVDVPPEILAAPDLETLAGALWDVSGLD